MIIRYFLIFLLINTFCGTLQAQRLITGKVLDVHTKARIENVDVTIYKGTATTTTKGGYFQLNVNDGDSLLLTHPDYNLGLIAVPPQDVFTVFLLGTDNYPVYLKGEAFLYRYLQENLVYPSKAISKRVEGVAVILLTIDGDGNMVDCKSLNEVEGNCTKNALEVFQEIPGEWSKGDGVKNLLFPVVFQLGRQRKDGINMPEFEMVKSKIMKPIFVVGRAGG